MVIAEDSPLLMKLISDSLIKSGYDNLTLCANGQEAWECLAKLKDTDEMDVACVITDLEMPLMDDQMRAKGEALGADVQLSKPEIGLLVNEIDKLLGR